MGPAISTFLTAWYIECALQISNLYSIPANHSALMIKRQSVQQQKGCVDCGLFAIVYAVEVCSRRNPEEAIFVQEKIRSHLLQCLSKGVVMPFPDMQIEDSVLQPK
jgi:hypothetical protein